MFRSARYVPYPLNVVSSSLPPPAVSEWRRQVPKPVGLVVSRRPSAISAEDYLFSALHAARQQADEEKREQWLLAHPGRKKRVSADVVVHDQQIGTVTFIDVLWRMRLQATYEDSAPFTSDGISFDDPQRILRSLIALVSSANLLFELLVAAHVGPALLHAALARCNRPSRAPSARPVRAAGALGPPVVTRRLARRASGGVANRV